MELGGHHFEIRVVSPLSFVATKLEAFLGRGQGDISASHDLEDLLLLFYGREELVDEIRQGDQGVVDFVAQQLAQLLTHPEFEWVVQSATHGDVQVENYLFERLEAIAGLTAEN